MMAAFALGGVGSDLALKTLSLTCGKAIDGITYLATSTSSPGFTEWDYCMKKTDIEIRIRNIKLLTDVLKKQEEEGNALNPLMSTCLADINQTIGQLVTILDRIKELRKYQETIYFNTWRFRLPDCSAEVAELQLYSEVLNTRVNELEKFSNIITNLASV